MKITVCIGSSCHLKGSHQIVEQLKKLIADNKVGDKVELAGAFCLGRCQEGVCVTCDDEFYSLSPDKTEEFFKDDVLAKLN
ncbi:MAG: NAD(P)H-dependent oxidoreductase subunit E [Eubacteriales bacterium]